MGQTNLNAGLMGYSPEEVEDFVERGKIPFEAGQEFITGYFAQ